MRDDWKVYGKALLIYRDQKEGEVFDSLQTEHAGIGSFLKYDSELSSTLQGLGRLNIVRV